MIRNGCFLALSVGNVDNRRVRYGLPNDKNAGENYDCHLKINSRAPLKAGKKTWRNYPLAKASEKGRQPPVTRESLEKRVPIT
ncbi:unnamed protein product, partial [Nesidiocoris tenuis]